MLKIKTHLPQFQCVSRLIDWNNYNRGYAKYADDHKYPANRIKQMADRIPGRRIAETVYAATSIGILNLLATWTKWFHNQLTGE